MSFYLSNSDIAPTGAEPVEFLDDPDLLGQADVCELPAHPPVVEAERTADPDPQRRQLLAAARVWFTHRGTL